MVPTVVGEPSVMRALPHLGFIPHALHVIQHDMAHAFLKVALSWGQHGLTAAELLAHHLGICQIPAVITHCAPGPIVRDLYSALTPVAAIHQSQGHP